MIFKELELQGAFLIQLEKLIDNRGYFSRTWCQREFGDQGLVGRLVQCNISYNHTQGTIRGLHYQLPPAAETKLVRCTRGAIFDVLVDLRPDSLTYLKWIGVDLDPDSGDMVYIPSGFAHGFQTKEDHTEVFYQMSEFYAPEAARGVRWDDPLIGVQWPAAVTIISEKDASYPNSTVNDFQGLRTDLL